MIVGEPNQSIEINAIRFASRFPTFAPPVVDTCARWLVPKMAFVPGDVSSENPIIRFAVSAAFSPPHQCLRNTRMERYGLLRGLSLAHSNYAINNRARHAHGPSGEVDVAPLQSKQFTLSQAG